MYASGYGRFNSPDKVGSAAGPKDPGGWNRYSYVHGDPVNANDPSGNVAIMQTDCSSGYCDETGYIYCGTNEFTGEPYDWNPACLNYGFAPPPEDPPNSGSGDSGSPAPQCSISLYERSAGGSPGNHTYLDVSGMVNGQYVNDVLEGNPVNKSHPPFRNPFSKGWPPLKGYIEPVAGGVFNGSTNPATNTLVETDTGADICGDISILLSAINSYNSGTLVPYMPIPRKGFYNSNSFTYTLLDDVGLQNVFLSPPGWNPGWGKLVPGL